MSANVFTLSTVIKSAPNVVVSSFVQPIPKAINKKAAEAAANKSLLCKAINFSKTLMKNYFERSAYNCKYSVKSDSALYFKTFLPRTFENSSTNFLSGFAVPKVTASA